MALKWRHAIGRYTHKAIQIKKSRADLTLFAKWKQTARHSFTDPAMKIG
jgi:hypothetical protein